jgi:ABC-type branched-subunit amino acid transport system substrate-binding protein
VLQTLRFLSFRGTAIGMAALLVGVTACGSNSGGSAATGPIRVALLAPLTGKYPNFGEFMSEGARAGVAAVNASGGINGRQLVLDLVDTQGDPIDATPAFQEEMAVNKPVALIGPTDLEIHSLQPLFDRAHIVDLFSGGDPSFDTNKDKWIFRINPSDSQLGVAIGLLASKQGYKNAAIISASAAGSEQLVTVIANTFKKLGGTIAVNVTISESQTSYRSEVLQVVNAHPDVIFVQCAPGTAGTLFGNFREVGGFKIPFIGTDSSATPDWVTALTPTVMHQVLTSVVGSSAPGGGSVDFTKFYKQLYNKEPAGGTNQFYDAVVDLALAITKAGGTSSTEISTALPQVSNPPGDVVTSYATGIADLKAGKKINYEGASGPMDFNQYQNVFGPFDVVKANTNGTFQTLQTLTAADLLAATS